MNNPVRIAHLITTLEYGGAENMLFKLASGIALNPGYQQMVISLTGKGVFGPLLEKQGIVVYAVGLQAQSSDWLKIIRMIIKISRFQPHILQTWLYHADLLGTLVTRITRKAKLIWNVRCSDMVLKEYARTTKLIFKTLQRLSGLPVAVCANSKAGILHHIQQGYHPKKWVWIPNGFDTDRFKPLPSKSSLKADLGIPSTALIIGMVARFDPMKGFNTFFQAASRTQRKHNHVHFVLIGNQVDFGNPYLYRLVEKHQLTDNVHLLGRRDDVYRIYPQMDVFTLTSSFGEGFPNVIGEAMACGVPCVATDVGDSKLIIGETGIIVPARDPQKLSGAWISLLNMDDKKRVELGLTARQRIIKHYHLEMIQKKYLDLYDSIM